jgi:hypothetical protein
MTRARARGFGLVVAIACCLLLPAWIGCGRSKCTSSAECLGGQLCGGPPGGPFECLRACATDANCGAGQACQAVTSADCTECGDKSSLACVAAGADAGDH